MSILIIQLPARQRPSASAPDAAAATPGPQSYAYVLSADGETLSRQGRGELTQMPPADSVVAVLAPTDVSWHRLTLPKAPQARLRAALASLLEDALLDEPEQLHLAVAPQAKVGQPTWVAVCDHTWLTSQLMALEKAKLRVERVVPGAAPDEPATALFHEAFEAGQGSSESGPEVLMTWASPEGVSTWPLGGSLSRGLLPDPLPPQARFFATPPVASPAERWLGRAVTVQTASEHMLLASRSLWNLLQFELAPRSKGAHALSDQWRRFLSPTWRPVRVGLAALVVVQVLGLNVWAWHLQHTLKSRMAQRVQLLQQAHPQVRVVLDAPVQMQRETDTLRTQAGAPGANDLEALMALVATAWPRETPSASLRYDGQALSVAPPSGWGAGEIEAFRAQLGAAGVQVDTQADGLLTVRRGPRS
ncbi:type II secretion system protein GspL [Aquabacterium sp.]|uniref:type II secretion system protein GspL n=1 Tax=Aquabacterium sp. TaxID=1872578 RepID=UPI0027BA8B13|nr:type II secretion system protein GspL [Aquabacterium sp.]